MLKKMVTGLICLLSILTICGCIGSDSSDQPLDTVESGDETTVSGVADYIGTFYAAKTEDSLKFTLIFNDADKKIVSPSGTAILTIYDNYDNKLYEKEYIVDPSKAGPSSKYTLVVLLSDISNGMTDSGYAEIVFTSDEGKTMNKIANSISIPYYTEEELLSISETEYLENSVQNGESDTLNDVKITVVRSGYYYVYGEKVQKFFRVDFELENEYGQPKDFTPSEVFVYDKYDTKYQFTTGGTLNDVSEIPALDKVTGYWLFEDVPENIDTPRIIFKNGRDDSGSWIIYDFSLE